MRYYRSYMDRQEISAGTHEKLMNLNAERKAPHRPWARYGALAACAALILGVGAWRLASGGPVMERNDLPAAVGTAPVPQQTAVEPPAASEAPEEAKSKGFVVDSPVSSDPLSFYFMPGIDFQDMTATPELAASRAFVPGTFWVDLTFEDIQKIFWGPEGVPEMGREEDLPWALFWDGYTVRGTACYDGEGQLTELTIYGEKGRAMFTLELCRGSLPFSCLVEPDRESSEFLGMEITGWSRAYDCDGDKVTDYICGSEFMTQSDIGVRFVSRNNAEAERGLDGESWFNTLFIRQAVPDGLYVDHLQVNTNIPAWRDASFDTLAQARQEAEFAPYLPASEPEAYSAYAGNKEFYSHLSYQEGRENMLFVRWSMGYDDVEVCVFRDGYGTCFLADPENPASYDVRLYEIPWCDSVPDQYWETVGLPAFRAEDMSLAIVEARGMEKDTGSMRFEFEVLHPDGTVVSYHCSGMTARQVWEMVQETLA